MSLITKLSQYRDEISRRFALSGLYCIALNEPWTKLRSLVFVVRWGCKGVEYGGQSTRRSGASSSAASGGRSHRLASRRRRGHPHLRGRRCETSRSCTTPSLL